MVSYIYSNESNIKGEFILFRVVYSIQISFYVVGVKFVVCVSVRANCGRWLVLQVKLNNLEFKKSTK